MKRLKKEQTSQLVEPTAEKAILVGISLGNTAAELKEAELSLAELEELAITAGAQVLGNISQRRPAPDPAYLIGKGKVEELAAACLELGADTVIFDEELSAAQMKNIEELTGCKVLDRTLVILDIFASRARSHEGKLQVELAQLQYRLSRLTGMGTILSRLGGGIGTRGPGETKLESDRRHINRRIHILRRALKEVASRRDRTRQRRFDQEVLTFAVVGYTNAGKSTLINQLCDSDLLAADQVFATLDPSVRRLELDDGSHVLLVDTVGLVRRLPHHLVDAFQATLQEAAEADAILEVIDASAPDAAAKMAVVEKLLDQLGASRQARFYVFNKIDLLESPLAVDPDQIDNEPSELLPAFNEALDQSRGRQSFLVSALNGQGMAELKQAIAEQASGRMLALRLLLPYKEAGRLDYIRRFGQVEQLDYQPEGIKAQVRIRYSHLDPLKPFVMLADPEK